MDVLLLIVIFIILFVYFFNIDFHLLLIQIFKDYKNKKIQKKESEKREKEELINRVINDN